MELTITISDFAPEKADEIKAAIQGLFPDCPEGWYWNVGKDLLEGTFGAGFFEDDLGDQIAEIAEAIWTINGGYCGVHYEVLELTSMDCRGWDQEDYEAWREG